MKDYRYSLERGSKKHTCPACGKRTYVLFIDNQTGEHLSNQFGRCDREHNCGRFEIPTFEKKQTVFLFMLLFAESFFQMLPAFYRVVLQVTSNP